MVEAVIKWLIALCFIVLAVFLVLWVLAQLGIMLPAIVTKVLWVVLVLVAVLYLYRTLKAAGVGWLP